MSNSFLSKSPRDTQQFAARFCRKLKPGDVVGLCGELGSGKTTFMKGVLKGLGGKRGASVTSPTFVLLHQYETQRGPLYHLDLYRMEKASELNEIDLDSLIKSNGFIFVEWADKFELLKSYCKTWIFFQMTGETARKVTVKR